MTTLNDTSTRPEIFFEVAPAEAQKMEVSTNFQSRLVETHEDLEQLRNILADIEAEAFKNTPAYVEHGINLIRESSDSFYYNKKNILIVLEDPETHAIEGFTLLIPHDENTYYETETCVIHQNRGFGSKLLQKRDEVLAERGIGFVVTHVEKDGTYAVGLAKKYEQVALQDIDTADMDSRQMALRLKVPVRV